MIVDASDLIGRTSEVRGDICIIGSGAAGISLAHRLIGSGKKVVLLEASRTNPPVDKTPQSTEPLYEGSVKGQLSSLDPRFLVRSRSRSYGGSTNRWGGWTTPLSKTDFDRRDLGPELYWPIEYDELAPYYNQAIQYCSLGAWDVSAYSQIDHWRGKTDPAFDVLELSPRSGLEHSLIAVVNGRGNFQEVWGPSIEIASNVSIVRNANVRHIETGPGQASVTKVRASTIKNGRAGRDFTVKADQYVLAAGGIECTRLLLASDRLADKQRLVGKGFNIHPVNHNAARFFSDKMPSPAVSRFYSHPHHLTRVAGLDHAPWIFPVLVPKSSTVKRERIGNFRALVNFDAGFINFCWEQIPNAASSITLDSKRDSIFGDRRVAIDWRSHEIDVDTIDKGLDLVLNELRTLGLATQYIKNVGISDPGDHHMGTTRMSKARTKGVVNADCRVHDVDNLHIASCSVFPTSGFANPTLTIVALALRLAERLAA